MNEEFINVYIEIMSKKIEELTRSDIMGQARLAMAEKIIGNFKSELEKLQAAYAELRDSIDKEKSVDVPSYELDRPSTRKVKTKADLAVSNDGGEV